MKYLTACAVILFACLGCGVAAAATKDKAPQTEAQKAYAAFEKMSMEQPPKDLPEEEQGLWYRIQFLKVCDAAERFIKHHPDDPLRWQALETYAMYTSNLESIVGGLRTQVNEVIAQALAAKDISDMDWQRAKDQQISALMRPAYKSAEAGQPADLAPIRTALGELAQRFPESVMSPALEMMYVELLKRGEPALARAWLEHLAAGPNKETVKLASGQLNIIKLREEPMNLKFTALDGREVDFANLRGKVVLIDFWATWCGPCVAEQPNIKAVYEQYHDKGFEVVGISLDRKDDEKKLREFVAARKLPWPQYFDGQDSNAVADRYGIFQIPTQLLLDREGRLVNDKARGETLRTEVSRLLGG